MRDGAQLSEVNDWVASFTHMGRHTGGRSREGRDDEHGLGTPGCSVTTGSQDAGLDRIQSSWSHCLTGGRRLPDFINRAGLAPVKYCSLDSS